MNDYYWRDVRPNRLARRRRVLGASCAGLLLQLGCVTLSWLCFVVGAVVILRWLV